MISIQQAWNIFFCSAVGIIRLHDIKINCSTPNAEVKFVSIFAICCEASCCWEPYSGKICLLGRGSWMVFPHLDFVALPDFAGVDWQTGRVWNFLKNCFYSYHLILLFVPPYRIWLPCALFSPPYRHKGIPPPIHIRPQAQISEKWGTTFWHAFYRDGRNEGSVNRHITLVPISIFCSVFSLFTSPTWTDVVPKLLPPLIKILGEWICSWDFSASIASLDKEGESLVIQIEKVIETSQNLVWQKHKIKYMLE